MFSPRRFVLLLCLALLAGWVVTGAVRGISQADPELNRVASTPGVVDGVRAKVEMPDGATPAKFEGEPMFASVKLKPSYGLVEFDTVDAAYEFYQAAPVPAPTPVFD